MANTGRAYKDPSPAAVEGAIEAGVSDPAILVDAAWTNDQKKRWSAQFNVLVKDLARRESEAKDEAFDQRVRARELSVSQPPVVRDVLGGVRQGVGDAGSVVLRGASLVSPPEHGQDSLADTANRLIEDHERVASLADTKLPVLGTLQRGLRGSTRSLTTAAALAPLGPAAVIGGAATIRGNQATTEAKDAGLTGSKAAGYVGRAALIEGGIAAIFQRFGIGGSESAITSGLTRATAGEMLRHTVGELAEENITEILDAHNQALSGITGPVTRDQWLAILKDTTVQTIMTLGLSKAHGRLATELALKPQALAVWADQNIDAARAIAATPNPSRKDFDEAGLPDTTKEGRAAAAENLREVVSILDGPPAAPSAGLAETPSLEVPGSPEIAEASPEAVVQPESAALDATAALEESIAPVAPAAPVEPATIKGLALPSEVVAAATEAPAAETPPPVTVKAKPTNKGKKPRKPPALKPEGPPRIKPFRSTAAQTPTPDAQALLEPEEKVEAGDFDFGENVKKPKRGRNVLEENLATLDEDDKSLLEDGTREDEARNLAGSLKRRQYGEVLRGIRERWSDSAEFTGQKVDAELGNTLGIEFGKALRDGSLKGLVKEVRTEKKNGKVTRFYTLTEKGRLAEVGSRLSIQEAQGEHNVEAEIERGIATGQLSPSDRPSKPSLPSSDETQGMPSGPPSTSTPTATKPKPGGTQAVEVTNAIRRLYPGLFVGPAGGFKAGMRRKDAAGFYKPVEGGMRLRELHDVPTELHELGHHLDRELDRVGPGRGSSAQIDAELERLGRDLYGVKVPQGEGTAEDRYRAEGFAEFMRFFLEGEGSLQRAAPAAYQWFTAEYLANNKAESSKIRELQSIATAYRAQTSQESVEALLRPTQKGWTDGKIAAWLGAFEAKWIDSNLPILRAMQATKADLSKLAWRAHTYVLATYFARTAGGRTRHAALSGTVDLYGRKNGEGLRDLLERHKVTVDKETYKSWVEYIVARRAQWYHTQGKNPGISEEAADEIVEKHKKRPGFEGALEDFTKFAHRNLHMLVEAGDMTQEDYDAIVKANEIYVPYMRRVESDGDEAGGGKGSGNAVHKVTKDGSFLPIHDPVDALLLQVEKIQQVAMQAAVARSMVQFYDKQKADDSAPFLAQFLSEEPLPVEATTFDAGQVRDAIRKAFLEAAGPAKDAAITPAEQARLDRAEKRLVAAMEAAARWAKNYGANHPGRLKAEQAVVKAREAFDAAAKRRKAPIEGLETLDTLDLDTLTVFTKGAKPNGRDGQNVISLVIDGKRRNFTVQPALVPILEGVTQSTFLPGQLGALVRGATSLQRLGTTGLNAAFSVVRNPLRDTLTAMITSDYHFHKPVWDSMKGNAIAIANAIGLKPDVHAQKYKAAGLAIGGQLGSDVKAAAHLSSEMRDGTGKKIARALLTPDGLREILSATEVGPRLMEFTAGYEHAYKAAYKAAKDRGATDEEAHDEADIEGTILGGAASKDVTVNFSRGGSMARQLNEIILFFNAAIQSTDKLARAIGAREAAPWAKSQSRAHNLAKTTAKGAAFLTSVALLLYLRNRDDDEWKKLPPTDKWTFLHVRVGKKLVRVPLPFEAGAIFGALPVAFLEGPKAFGEALGVALKSNTPLDLNGLHGLMRNVTLLGPIADVMANEDWKGAPIVSEGDKRLLPRDQFGPRTTSLAKMLGAAAPGGGISPAKLEHLLDGYTGGLYRRVMVGAVEMLSGKSPVQPYDDPSTIPVLGTLFLRPGTSREVGDFYDRLEWLRQRKESKVATLEEQGELAQAERASEKLSAVWKKRRGAIVSDESGANVKAQTEALLGEAQGLIRAHEKRETKGDRSVGLGTLLYRATDPEAKGVKLPEGITEKEALEALRAEALRRAEDHRASEKRRGRRVKPLVEYARLRDDSGNWTAFGQRQARLLKALRGK